MSIRLFDTPEAVANAAAADAVALMSDLLDKQPEVHVCLTGGTVGILTIAKLLDQPAIWDLDWSRVHLWWGDERFVAQDSKDRNAMQAYEAALSQLPLRGRNVHEFPAFDAENPLGIDSQLSSAVDLFELELSPYLDTTGMPNFDLAFVGMGPDGHICSLFPGKPEIASGVAVIAEHDSPKPPPHRLSFSYEAMSNCKRIWFTVAGADKAPAVANTLRGQAEFPAARVKAQIETIWYLDTAAASELAE